MTKRFIFSVLFCLIGFISFSQTNKDRQKILEILDKQNQAWNRGDVVAFMKGYWESDSLMYIGKNGVTYGYQKTLASYQKNYPDKASMGTLKFTIIKVNFLGPNNCLLVGKWALTRPEKGDIGGHFTLTWQKIKGEWVIIADHSS